MADSRFAPPPVFKRSFDVDAYSNTLRDRQIHGPTISEEEKASQLQFLAEDSNFGRYDEDKEYAERFKKAKHLREFQKIRREREGRQEELAAAWEKTHPGILKRGYDAVVSGLGEIKDTVQSDEFKAGLPYGGHLQSPEAQQQRLTPPPVPPIVPTPRPIGQPSNRDVLMGRNRPDTPIAPQGAPSPPLPPPNVAGPPHKTGEKSNYGRDIYRRADGYDQTERRASFPIDPKKPNGLWASAPSLYGGKETPSDDQVREIVKKNNWIDPETGEKIPLFANQAEADAFADQHSQSIMPQSNRDVYMGKRQPAPTVPQPPAMPGQPGPPTGTGLGEKVGGYLSNLEKAATMSPMTALVQEAITPSPKTPIKELSEYTKGFGRGILSTGAQFIGGGAAVAELLGYEETSKRWLETYGTLMNEAQQFKGEVDFENAFDSPGQFVSWAAGLLGEQTPVIASMVISGGISGVIAKAIAKRVVGGRAAVLTAEQIRKVQAWAERGSKAGAFGAMTGVEGGGIFGEGYEESLKDPNVKPNALLALAGGTINGALELIVPFTLLKVIRGSKQAGPFMNDLLQKMGESGLLTRIAAMAGGTAIAEGVTEGLQEEVAILARGLIDEKYEMFGPEALARIGQSVVSGAVIGGVGGAGAGATIPSMAPRQPPPLVPEGTMPPPSPRTGPSLVDLPVPGLPPVQRPPSPYGLPDELAIKKDGGPRLIKKPQPLPFVDLPLTNEPVGEYGEFETPVPTPAIPPIMPPAAISPPEEELKPEPISSLPAVQPEPIEQPPVLHPPAIEPEPEVKAPEPEPIPEPEAVVPPKPPAKPAEPELGDFYEEQAKLPKGEIPQEWFDTDSETIVRDGIGEGGVNAEDSVLWLSQRERQNKDRFIAGDKQADPVMTIEEGDLDGFVNDYLQAHPSAAKTYDDAITVGSDGSLTTDHTKIKKGDLFDWLRDEGFSGIEVAPKEPEVKTEPPKKTGLLPQPERAEKPVPLPTVKAPETPKSTATPDRRRSVFLGKNGQRTIEFPNEYLAELFDFTSKLKKSIEGGPTFDTQHAVSRLKEKLNLPDEVNVGDIAQRYRRAVLDKAGIVPEGSALVFTNEDATLAKIIGETVVANKKKEPSAPEALLPKKDIPRTPEPVKKAEPVVIKEPIVIITLPQPAKKAEDKQPPPLPQPSKGIAGKYDDELKRFNVPNIEAFKGVSVTPEPGSQLSKKWGGEISAMKIGDGERLFIRTKPENPWLPLSSFVPKTAAPHPTSTEKKPEADDILASIPEGLKVERDAEMPTAAGAEPETVTIKQDAKEAITELDKEHENIQDAIDCLLKNT